MRRACCIPSCENRVEYEFRDAPEEGGITRWCEQHVQVYMTQRQQRLDDEAHARALKWYNEQLESDAKIAYAKMKQENYEKDLRKKTSQFSMAFSPGDLWHMVTCGCQPGSQRELIVDDGMGMAYCHTCNFFLGKARIQRADLETNPGYTYDSPDVAVPIGKILGDRRWLSVQIEIDLGNTRQLRGYAPNTWARAPMEHKIIQEEQERGRQHKIDEMFGVSQRSDAVSYQRNPVPSGKFDDQMLHFLTQNTKRKKPR